MSSRFVMGLSSGGRGLNSTLSRLVSLRSWPSIRHTPSLPRASSAASSSGEAPRNSEAAPSDFDFVADFDFGADFDAVDLDLDVAPPLAALDDDDFDSGIGGTSASAVRT